MTLERTFTRAVPKPWGSTDLRPWNSHHGEDVPIGELWFQRSDPKAPESALLLKILFTTQPLSIQVHPDDRYARSIGLKHGKCEAWYILSALPHARIALGLTRQVNPSELRSAIDSGVIAELVRWWHVSSGETILVPPGTIHAIGSGIVLVEIQQRSEATFRLFDFGRQRELHTDDAIAAASGEPIAPQAPWRKLSNERTLLVADQHFLLERIELSRGADWELLAPQETWLFVLEGRACVGPLDACTNEAIFLEAEAARIQVRSRGLLLLVAYVGGAPHPRLLRRLEDERIEALAADQSQGAQAAEPMWALMRSQQPA
jgi:mannose-6-phosphate isomerase